MLDYSAIGKRIKDARKKSGLSQEQLAEKVWISTTHMSHIESGSTKLSLVVLADIAAVLGVSTDSLLFGASEDAVHKNAEALLRSCTKEQAEVIFEIIKSAKGAMDKNLRQK